MLFFICRSNLRPKLNESIKKISERCVKKNKINGLKLRAKKTKAYNDGF